MSKIQDGVTNTRHCHKYKTVSKIQDGVTKTKRCHKYKIVSQIQDGVKNKDCVKNTRMCYKYKTMSQIQEYVTKTGYVTNKDCVTNTRHVTNVTLCQRAELKGKSCKLPVSIAAKHNFKNSRILSPSTSTQWKKTCVINMIYL